MTSIHFRSGAKIEMHIPIIGGRDEKSSIENTNDAA